MIEIKIDQTYDQMYVREFLKSFHLSKSKIYNFELHKTALINNKYLGLDEKLKIGDVLTLKFNGFHANPVIGFEGLIHGVYEDEDILILNKQAGVLVHTDGVTQDSLTNRIASHYETNYPILPVHRLDYETSGLLVFAKHPLSHAYLSNLFESREVKKTYLALVSGNVIKDSGWIKEPIGKDRHKNIQRVTKNGQDAQTHFKVLKRFDDQTLLEIMIIGGRKHQIRVHLAYMNHPVIGDKLYGKNISEQMELKLHFKHISFTHPRYRKEFELDSNQSL